VLPELEVPWAAADLIYIGSYRKSDSFESYDDFSGLDVRHHRQHRNTLMTHEVRLQAMLDA
jgi:hypothetical protein